VPVSCSVQNNLTKLGRRTRRAVSTSAYGGLVWRENGVDGPIDKGDLQINVLGCRAGASAGGDPRPAFLVSMPLASVLHEPEPEHGVGGGLKTMVPGSAEAFHEDLCHCDKKRQEPTQSPASPSPLPYADRHAGRIHRRAYSVGVSLKDIPDSVFWTLKIPNLLVGFWNS